MDFIKETAQPGDVLLSRINGELTNYFIPGFYGHAAIVCAKGKIVESIGKGVRETSIGTFLSDKDYIGIFRGNFGEPLSREKAGIRSRSYVGRSYDYGFKIGKEEFYCSELVWQAYKDTHPDMVFCKREIFGVKTVLPDDFTCVRYWDNIQSIIGTESRV